jgi:putative ABC transport system permease protein
MAAASRLDFFLRWIAASALTVSGLGIVAITWIALKERTREIGTRRAPGATWSDIFFQVLVETAALAVTGSFLGAVVSWPASHLVSESVGLPFVFEVKAAAFAFTIGVTLNLVFSILPSRGRPVSRPKR